MIDLDNLEVLAKAALSRGQEDCESLSDWFSQEEFMSNMLLHPVDARFAEACTPSSILALIAEVRVLREDAERWRLARDQATIYQGNNVGCFVEFKKYDAEPAERPRIGKAFTDAVDAAIDAARAKEPK